VRRGAGRIFSLTLGHYGQTYSNPSVLRLLANGLAWAGGAIGDLYDAFLSFASADERYAREIEQAAREEFGLRVFLSATEIASGEQWAERIRRALLASREVCVLVSPSSLRSDWVAAEWGAAWALGKRITPVLLRCDVTQLPELLRGSQAIDLHEHRRLLGDMKQRRALTS
jgi:hypothetical protein